MLRQRLSQETMALLQHLMLASNAPRDFLIRAVIISGYIINPCLAYQRTLMSQSSFKEFGSCVHEFDNVVSFMVNASTYRVTALFLSPNNFPVANIRSLVDAFHHRNISMTLT